MSANELAQLALKTRRDTHSTGETMQDSLMWGELRVLLEYHIFSVTCGLRWGCHAVYVWDQESAFRGSSLHHNERFQVAFGAARRVSR